MQKIILFFGSKSQSSGFYYKIEKKYNCKIIICSYLKFKTKNYLFLEKNRELEIIKEFAKDKKIIAVINKSDTTEILHGKLVDLFNIPGPNYKSIRLFKDKVRIHKKIVKNNLSFYRPTTLITELENLREDLKNVQYPVVIKPFAGAKSRGVFKLDNYEEIEDIYPLLENHFKKEKSLSIKESKNKKILLEQYIKGKVVTAEYFVDSYGKLHPIFFTDVITAQDLKYDHMQHIYRTTPSNKSEFHRKKIEYLLKKLVKISKLKSTCIHPEFFVLGQKIYLIELNVRIGGFRNRLSKYAYGLSLEKIAFKLALDEKVETDFKFIKSSTACEVWEQKSGIIQKFILPKSKYIKRSKTFFNKDDKYICPPEGNTPLAFFIIQSEENSLKIAKKLRKKVKIDFIT